MSDLNFAHAMTQMSARALRVVLTALLVTLLGACKHADECRYDEFSCDGDVAMECVHVEASNGSYYAWQSTACGAGKCKLDTSAEAKGAFCALDAAPEPRCDEQRSTFCNGTTLTSCRAGYAVSALDCAVADPAGGFCITPSKAKSPWATPEQLRTAMCAVEPEPNPLCQAAWWDAQSQICDGNDSLSCVLGYVRSRDSCGDRFCRNDGACVITGDPEPKCAPDRLWSSFCEDNAMVSCSQGYRMYVQPCAAGNTCRIYPVPCREGRDACTSATCEP